MRAGTTLKTAVVDIERRELRTVPLEVGGAVLSFRDKCPPEASTFLLWGGVSVGIVDHIRSGFHGRYIYQFTPNHFGTAQGFRKSSAPNRRTLGRRIANSYGTAQEVSQ